MRVRRIEHLRLTSVVAALLASPAMASDEIPAQARYAIDALVAARFIIAKCPSYSVDQATLIDIMVETGLTVDDLAGRYKQDMEAADAKAQSHEGSSDQGFCEALYERYRAEDTAHPLIDRR